MINIKIYLRRPLQACHPTRIISPSTNSLREGKANTECLFLRQKIGFSFARCLGSGTEKNEILMKEKLLCATLSQAGDTISFSPFPRCFTILI